MAEQYTSTNPYGFTRAQMIENFVDATRLHNDTNDKWWATQSDVFAKYATDNGITQAELLEAWLGA